MGLGGGELEERTGSKAEGSTSSLLPKFTFLGGFCYKVENEMLLDALLRLIRAFLWPLPRRPHPSARHPTSQRLCYTVISKGSPGPAWGTPLGTQSTSPPLILPKQKWPESRSEIWWKKLRHSLSFSGRPQMILLLF